MPEKSNIWRDCVDGYLDWVKEHIEEVRSAWPAMWSGRQQTHQKCHSLSAWNISACLAVPLQGALKKTPSAVMFSGLATYCP